MISEKDILRFLYFFVSVLAVVALGHSYSCSASERIELYDATLQDFVEWSSTQLNRSVVVGADIRSAPISVFASYDSPAALEKLVEEAVVSSGFHFSSIGGVIRIGSAPFKAPLDLVTEVVQLQHLQSDFAFQAVRDVLASRAAGDDKSAPTVSQASVSPSPTSNALIVTATRDQLAAIRTVLAEVDRPRRQVVITAVVAELADDDFDALGLNVSLDSGDTSLAGVTIGSSDFASDLGFSLTFSGPTLGAFLRAVRSTGNNKILSTPQLLTLNREAASIVVGQNVPFVTGQTTSGSTPASDPFQTIVRQDVGVSLSVTPFITPADAIELEVEQSASSVSDDRTAADIITNTRRILTKVQLKDGEGVLLGGLRSEQTDKSSSAVPILSEIPWLGKVFRSRSSRVRATNLVVLLTAKVYREGDAVKVPDALREPARLMLPALGMAPGGIGAAGDTGGQVEGRSGGSASARVRP